MDQHTTTPLAMKLTAATPAVTSVFSSSPYRRTAQITPSDITMVICVRAHGGNTWVLDRLRLVRDYYDPLPQVLIVDFGSSEEFAREVSAICSECGFSYWHEPDTGTYSPAAAHNRGYEQSSTDLIFFCDADCFGSRDMFERLSSIATALRMKDVIDTPIVLPVYHINEADTANFLAQSTPEDRSRYLDAFTFYAGISAFRRAENFFIAPYSNIFLINRRMFSLTGGYDERFRGHGSEDFEYLTRLAVHIKNLPLPVNIKMDWLGPLTRHFFKARPYSGFRRLLEALAKPAENFGLRVHHLYHPKPLTAEWESNNDWKRARLNDAFDAYLDREHNLLTVDSIARDKVVICLCKHTDQWGYFIPLRIAGYKLEPVFDDTGSTIAAVTAAIVDGRAKALAIFNPHMKSHANFKQLVMLARDMGLKVIVIERGALPNTIYYNDEVAYSSEAFSESSFLAEEFSSQELHDADVYVADLQKGNKTLENMDGYESTSERYSALSALSRPICFIPLQLEDDMAVTMFIKGEQTYPEFVASLDAVIDQHPDVVFVVKPHPLSKLDLLKPKPNLIIAEREDNVHFLIDAAKVTVCYNSSVGLLSLIHGTPTITIGNAFYNIAGVGHRAASLAEAIDIFVHDKADAPDEATVRRLVAWFCYRKYSTFIAADNIRDLSTRKSHGYKDILVTHFRWDGIDMPLGRQRQVAPYSETSYISSQLSDTLGSEFASKASAPTTPNNKPLIVVPVPLHRRPFIPTVRPFVAVLGTKKDVQKFNADPAGFFAALSNPWYRAIGRALFPPPNRR